MWYISDEIKLKRRIENDKRLERLPKTKKEKIKNFNHRSRYISDCVNIHHNQDYRKINLKEFYHCVFGRSLDFTDFSNGNITQLSIPFEKKYGTSSTNEEAKYVYNNIIIGVRRDKTKPKEEQIPNKNYIVLNDLEILKEVEKETFALTSPVTYIGRNRNGNNARFLYAITIDLDYMIDENIRDLTHQINHNHIPQPNILVNSGNGLHLYYILDTPYPLFRENQRILDKVKENLTFKVWNQYTSLNMNVQYQNVLQGYRLPDTQTKFGKKVQAFLNVKSKYHTIEELDSYTYLDENKLTEDEFKQLERSLGNKEKSINLEKAAELWPEWYQRVVVEGQEPKYITFNRKLYDWWLKKLNNKVEVNVGHRYYCAMVAVAFATKCKIPKEEVAKDLYNLVNDFDEMTNDEDNHFTRGDIDDALSIYGTKTAHKMTRQFVDRQTNIISKPQKRNGRNQKTHMRLMVITREADYQDGKKSRPSRKNRSKEIDLLRDYLIKNPLEKNKSKIARELNISRSTVKRRYDCIKKELSENKD